MMQVFRAVCTAVSRPVRRCRSTSRRPGAWPRASTSPWPAVSVSAWPISLDGAEHTNRFDQTGMPMPFPDSLQEFRVSTSTQEAGTARASGASVNAVTRSGTNQFHGDLFWFGRHAAFNARKADATRDDGLKRNQPGFTSAVRSSPNRLFFFTGLPEHDPRPGAVGHAVDRADGGDARRRLVRRSTSCYRPTWRDTDFADGSVSPDSLQSGGACGWRHGCRKPRIPAAKCAGAMRSSGTTSRSSRASISTHTANHIHLRPLHGHAARPAGAVRAESGQPAQHDRQRLQRPPSLARRWATPGWSTPTS